MSISSFFKRNQFSQILVAITLFLMQSYMVLPEGVKNLKPKELSAPFFKMITIGYWPAAVDYLWIETLQIIGDKKYSTDLVPFAANFYELATDLDPSFYELYEQAGVLFSLLFKNPDLSIHFLEKGVNNAPARWTHLYTLHLLTAYLYSYEKNNWEKAREYYLKAANVPGSPAYLQNMKIWLVEPGSEKKLAQKVLKLLASQASDELLKSQYMERLKAYE